MIVELFETDLETILDLETRAFPPGMRASAETYRKRFHLGHIVLGFLKEELQGVISFSYGCFDKANPGTIPSNFKDWSMQPVPRGYNTVFLYNLGLAPTVRGFGVVRALVHQAFRRAMEDGCSQAVAEGPIPTYAGKRNVRLNPLIRAQLDAYARGEGQPDQDLLFTDPHLALYRRLIHCDIIRICPDFLPEDDSSGGFRAMLYRDMGDLELPQARYSVGTASHAKIGASITA